MIPLGLIFGVAGAATKYKATLDSVAANTEELEAQLRLLQAQRVDVLTQGATAAGRLRSEGTRLVAQQAQAYRASGIEATSNTAQDVYRDATAQSELEAQTARNNAVRQAWGLQLSSAAVTRRIALEKKRGQDAGLEAALGLGGSLLSGGLL